MAGTFHLRILTPQGVKLDEDVEAVTAPGVAGYFGVHRGHAPMVAELTIGQVRVRRAGGAPELRFACSGGMAEVSPGEVTILGDSIEEAHEIDVERAQQAMARARARLRMRQDPNVDVRRAEAALARALNRLKAAITED